MSFIPVPGKYLPEPGEHYSIQEMSAMVRAGKELYMQQQPPAEIPTDAKKSTVKNEKAFVFGNLTYRMEVGTARVPFNGENRSDSQDISTFKNCNEMFLTDNNGKNPADFSVNLVMTELLGVSPVDMENELRRAMAEKVIAPIIINGVPEKTDGNNTAFWSISGISKSYDEPTRAIMYLAVTFVEVNEDMDGYNGQG